MTSLRYCCLVVPMLFLGCTSENSLPTPPPPPPTPAEPVAQAAPPQPAPPDPAVQWSQKLSQAEKHLEAGEHAEAKAIAAELAAAKLGDELSARLEALKAALLKHEQQLSTEAREKALSEAQKLVADGDLEAATRAADGVLNSGPTAEQRLAAGEIKKQVEEQRKARLRLKTAMRLLSSSKRADVRAAQEQLFAEPESAWPLIAEATRSENPELAANALEMLRVFNQPAKSIPLMLAVLSRTQQKAVWPAAIGELQKIAQPGAGEPLLELAKSTMDDDVRKAALQTLAGIIDPPPQTAMALLPLVYQDTPALAEALAALRHAIEVHRQQDLAALRGIDEVVTSEQRELLSGLGPRLIALAGDPNAKSRTPAAENALKLGIATGLIGRTPLQDVKVSRHSGEEPTNPAAAVLDGQWTSAKPETSWRYPLSGQAYIVLDLGEERTVTGVRIWNYNQPGANHRGWKEVDIYVDPRPALLAPVATGLASVAPPTADATDYSVLLTVPFVRGRYVKLQPRSYWRADTQSGLAEIQILGY